MFNELNGVFMELKNKELISFVDGASESLFPINNLPYGVFHRNDDSIPHIGTAIGNYVLDLTLLEQEGFLKCGDSQSLFNHDALNVFASQGQAIWTAVRRRIQSLLSIDNHELQSNDALLSSALIPQSKVTMLLPFKIEGFSDFYASEQ